ncbi:MAG: type IX secretion system protein PorQ [Prevotellaceae bacterium]|jgi:hypothetical protein|nr:type IX secretion system protein PorQ [Prevotellaceae bacterium]
MTAFSPNRTFVTACFIVIALVEVAAQAGRGTYQFLNLPSSARTVGYGGFNVSIFDDDINLAFNNPGLLSAESHNMMTFNFADYLADIKFGSVAFGRSFGEKNHTAYGIHYFDYGKFLETTDADVQLGTFTAKDIALNIAYSRTLSKYFTVGGAFKPVYSVYERYTSFGTAFDLGISYHNDSALFSAGLVVRNIGWQFKGYYSIDGQQHREWLPLDIQLGVSQKFRHAPIRLSMTLHNLQRWNLAYERSSNVTYVTSTDDTKWVDMLFRHVVFSVEIIPSKNFSLVASYNHRRRKEMSITNFINQEGSDTNTRSIAGFSFGAAVKIYKFRAGFALTPYQVGNLSYHFTLSTALSEFGVK